MGLDLTGVIPPLVTPFTADGSIDEAAFRKLIRFNLDKKVHGVCPGGSSGEGHTLTIDEFSRLMEITAAEVAGQVPIVAGIISNSTRDAINRAKAISHLPVAALQVTPVHYLFKPDEEATHRHFKALTEAVDIPVIIYNVVPWNYLNPAQMIRLMNELPGVQGIKQSQGDLKLMADLLLGVPKGCKVFSAVDALLYSSFALGAHGTIAATPAALPGVCVALWNTVQAGDHVKALEMHKSMLAFWNAVIGDNLPANLKTTITLQGCDAGLPRAPMPPTTAAQRARIETALEDVLRFDA
ncbi:4-hydroxy-tetrahydrodipicolinate synthase (plasmid) [Variovorax sp. V59]|jgi:4-hydroxy-tetrahydrodipicolinate synthase|uniref:4-hydroxy-tetrahydrodipicolinate synthase n=2 Tax=Variovorax TaxID=34072 RepID=A0AAE4C0C9_VARPD|nr:MULTISPECIES: dihydrodipicolinate synthase family protein [Variovorax]MDP9965325.1 4-hydroxy-tetrahydrodipicolinate synthase [Variovorax paradoxus]MDR6430008.1 4-hydroxy-tetrahydrodipicolinate synthase [Variovorax paradoxus]MDR6456457.1 4-hydroxy-tetrahydrodipicolinate synthase [Variovorax paradoxus]TWD76183.1 4-hydroxy-tetrahydrodipicolinate synthase [Variovorax beijingensis]